MKEHSFEKNFALKALYHAEVAEGGKYQLAYQANRRTEKVNGLVASFVYFFIIKKGSQIAYLAVFF